VVVPHVRATFADVGAQKFVVVFDRFREYDDGFTNRNLIFPHPLPRGGLRE